jgi:iron complex outermembrane receptor protein
MNKRQFMIFLALTIGFILAHGDLSALFAQEASKEEFTLEEITVTAQKRAENQQKVPIAMETISGDVIKELGKTDIDQILSTVSSVIINKAADGMRVTLRGMSNDNPIFQGMQASTPTVAVNMDGAYTNRNSAGNNLYDVERVEVLYGPQSTMYSSPSPGGVVNIVTANPKVEQFEGSFNLEGGNYNLKHGEATVNIPVMSKVAFRVAAAMTKRDGYLTNGAEDEDTKSARFKALFQATDKLSLLFIGEISKMGGQGFGGVALFDKQDKVKNPWEAQVLMGQTTALPQAKNDQVNKKYSGRIDFDMGFASLTILPSYSPRNNETTSIGTPPGPPVPYNIIQHMKQTGYEKSIEARFTSSTDFMLFKWIFGMTWYHSWDEAANTDIRSDNLLLDSYGNRYQNQRSKAIYGNITYPITDQFRATGGLRYTSETNYSYNLESARNNGQPEIVDMTYSSPDYKVGVEYDLAANSMLYSDYSTSYRTQGMGTDAAGNAFPAEKLKAITLGSKNRFLGNRMQVNASAYYYMYQNYMAVTGVSTLNDNYTGPGAHVGLDYVDNNHNGKFDINIDTVLDGIGTGVPGPGSDGVTGDPSSKVVGDAKVYGLDVQTSTMVTQNLKVDLSVSYLRKYFTNLFFPFLQITNDLGIPDLDYSGKDMTFAPHWTVTASLSHNIPLPNGGTLTPRLDSRYQTSYKMYFLDTALNISKDRTAPFDLHIIPTDLRKFALQEPYHISDFTLVYAHPNGKWTLTGYAKNLENYAVKRSIVVMGNMSDMMIGSPRTIGGILSVKF